MNEQLAAINIRFTSKHTDGAREPNNSAAEPWGKVAFDTLDNWLLGKIVRIVQDTTVQNSDDELPRYLYLSDSLINLRMIELGLGRSHHRSTEPGSGAQAEADTTTAMGRHFAQDGLRVVSIIYSRSENSRP